MRSIVDSVSSVVSQCLSHSGSTDMAQLDMDLISLMSASSQVGDLLDEILVTRQIEVDGSVLADLRRLHLCLNQLCLEYQTKLFNSMSGVTDSSRSLASIAVGEQRGRPKKIINLAFVCLIINFI